LTRAPAAQTIVAGCRLWVEAVEKILRGPPSNIDSRQTLNAQVRFNKFPRDSIVARRWHAADFFNSIGHRPLSRPCAGSVCSSFNSGRNAALHYPPASCQERTHAVQQIARFQGPHLQTDSAMGMQAGRPNSLYQSISSQHD